MFLGTFAFPLLSSHLCFQACTMLVVSFPRYSRGLFVFKKRCVNYCRQMCLMQCNARHADTRAWAGQPQVLRSTPGMSRQSTRAVRSGCHHFDVIVLTCFNIFKRLDVPAQTAGRNPAGTASATGRLTSLHTTASYCRLRAQATTVVFSINKHWAQHLKACGRAAVTCKVVYNGQVCSSSLLPPSRLLCLP